MRLRATVILIILVCFCFSCGKNDEIEPSDAENPESLQTLRYIFRFDRLFLLEKITRCVCMNTASWKTLHIDPMKSKSLCFLSNSVIFSTYRLEKNIWILLY